jgi:hypothetical protein
VPSNLERVGAPKDVTDEPGLKWKQNIEQSPRGWTKAKNGTDPLGYEYGTRCKIWSYWCGWPLATQTAARVTQTAVWL